MNDDALKKLWQEQQFAPASPAPDSELIPRMKTKMKKFNRTLFWRDARELIVCVFLALYFSYMIPLSPSRLSAAGCVVIVLSCIFIGWRLVAARRAHPRVPETAPTGDFVRAELASVKRQIHLLRTVLWWYLLPLFIGVELFLFGFPQPIGNLMGPTAVVVGVFAFVYWLNQWAVRKTLVPLQQELEKTLGSLPEFPSQSPNL